MSQWLQVGEMEKCTYECAEFEWRLTESHFDTDDENLMYTTPDFSFGNISWYLQLYPVHPTDCIELYIFNVSEGEYSIECSCTFKKESGRFARSFIQIEDCNPFNCCYIERTQLWPEKEISHSSVLLISCTFKRKIMHSNDLSQKETPMQFIRVDRLVQDWRHLLENEQNSDVTLKVEDREFRVHRLILMVRSPVFASIFRHDTKENATGIVDIPDCTAEAFQAFLTYVYTGGFDALFLGNIFDLYYVADKYQTADLKSECVKFVESNLSVVNFCDVMTLSLQHSESGLQDTATAFFCENVKKIIKTVQWHKYMKTFPTEANELYIKAIDA